MPKCKLNKTMETKTCGVPCYECEHYDKRNQKARIADEARERAKQKAIDIEEYDPADCESCKYFEGGTGGWCDDCNLSGKSFTVRVTRERICPLKKYRSRQNGQ